MHGSGVIHTCLDVHRTAAINIAAAITRCIIHSRTAVHAAGCCTGSSAVFLAPICHFLRTSAYVRSAVSYHYYLQTRYQVGINININSIK